MKTYEQLGEYLAELLLELKIFQTKVLEKIKIHFTFNKTVLLH